MKHSFDKTALCNNGCSAGASIISIKTDNKENGVLFTRTHIKEQQFYITSCQPHVYKYYTCTYMYMCECLQTKMCNFFLVLLWEIVWQATATAVVPL